MNIDLKVRNARYVKCPQVEDGTMILEHRASLYSHSQGEYIMMWVVQTKVGYPEHKTLCAGAYADISILVNNDAHGLFKIAAHSMIYELVEKLYYTQLEGWSILDQRIAEPFVDHRIRAMITRTIKEPPILEGYIRKEIRQHRTRSEMHRDLTEVLFLSRSRNDAEKRKRSETAAQLNEDPMDVDPGEEAEKAQPHASPSKTRTTDQASIPDKGKGNEIKLRQVLPAREWPPKPKDTDPVVVQLPPPVGYFTTQPLVFREHRRQAQPREEPVQEPRHSQVRRLTSEETELRRNVNRDILPEGRGLSRLLSGARGNIGR